MIILADWDNKKVQVTVNDTPLGRILAWAWVESLRTGEVLDLTKLKETDGSKVVAMAARAYDLYKDTPRD